MNRQQRRMQQRKERKKPVAEQQYELDISMIQPWSTFIMKTRLPDAILGKMLEITDEIVDNAENAQSWGHNLAGQIEHELYVEHEKLHEAGIYGFFMDIVRHYVIAAKSQQNPFAKEVIQQENWLTQMLSMWIISQKDGEYNPMHIHTECNISTVMYLKIPEYLPSRKSHREDDGNIVFVNSTCNDAQFVSPQFSYRPEVGDFFIFPSQQSHFVYPFRTADGKGERRSVSFNAIFSTEREVKEQQENHKKQMEEFQKQNKKVYQGDIPTLSMKNEEKSEVKHYEGDVGKFHQS